MNTLTRRGVLQTAAAAGLLATAPAALGACATGGDDGDTKTAEGDKTNVNPLGVKDDAPLEVVTIKLTSAGSIDCPMGGSGMSYVHEISPVTWFRPARSAAPKSGAVVMSMWQ